MLREKGCMEIKAISLSNNTVQCSIGEITENNKGTDDNKNTQQLFLCSLT
jgi:hypothetical protein